MMNWPCNKHKYSSKIKQEDLAGEKCKCNDFLKDA